MSSCRCFKCYAAIPASATRGFLRAFLAVNMLSQMLNIFKLLVPKQIPINSLPANSFRSEYQCYFILFFQMGAHHLPARRTQRPHKVRHQRWQNRLSEKQIKFGIKAFILKGIISI